MWSSVRQFMALDEDWQRLGPSRGVVRLPVLGAVSVADILTAVLGVVLLAVNTWAVTGLALARNGAEQISADAQHWATPLVIASMGVQLALRRRFPVAVGLFAAAHLLVIGNLLPLVETTFTAQAICFVCLYTLVAWGRDRRMVWGTCGFIVVFFLVWLGFTLGRTRSLVNVLHAFVPDHDLTPDLAARVVVLMVTVNIGFVASAVLLGQVSWNGARDLARARRQEATIADQDAKLVNQAVLEERLRIARDIHDTVAHGVSVIGVQAAGARRVMEADPELARAAMQTVEVEAREAVSQIRSIIGSLRDPEDVAPSPGLGELAALCAASTVPADLDLVGPAEEVDSARATACHRIVQEALTNAGVHSCARHVHVAVRVERDFVEVEVTDDGHGRARPVKPGHGYGLRGMRERVEALRGTLEVGPRHTRGWRVRAVLPSPLDRADRADGADWADGGGPAPAPPVRQTGSRDTERPMAPQPERTKGRP